ncbi:MAG: type II secretion system protein [Alphaproteobacteria bacterium]|nr:type II secretion system protein [Alphaproteobacteria bacterium]
MRSVSSPQPESGFTLLELVVALAILGLGMTFVLPRLFGWIDRLEFASRRQGVEDSLANIGGEARRIGRTIILRSSDSGSKSREDARVDLPAGWALTVDPPIAFRYDGLCTGGVIFLKYPGGDQAYRLVAPYCRLEPQ